MNTLHNKTVIELKEICREQVYRGFSKKNKVGLIKLITDNGYVDRNDTSDDESDVEDIDSLDDNEIVNHVELGYNYIKEHINCPENYEISGFHDPMQRQIYELYKQDKGNEITVFHGTHEKHLSSILTNGFSLTNKIEHGSRFGNGIYFAKCQAFASMYPKTCESRVILIVKIYNKNIILGSPKYDIPPNVLNSPVHYDTYVDNIKKPQQFVKNNEKSYHIIGYIKCKIQPKQVISKKPNTISLIFENTTDCDIHICYINRHVNKEVHLITLDDCVIMNKIPLKPSYSHSLISYINHRFMCGFFLDGNFINILYVKLDGVKRHYII